MESEDLFDHAMKDQWQQVFEKYIDSNTQKQKITRSKDTALHIAASKNRTDVVMKLVSMIKPDDIESVLSTENARGNTPLHLAAAIGNEQMCNCMARKFPKLIEYQNKERENPLFLAALFNKKGAFICLHNIYTRKVGDALTLFRKGGDDGDTILHTAINGDFFDFSYEIIINYPKLMNMRNVRGFSPLHALAKKPHAFESGNHPGFFDWLVYQCIIVAELKRESTASGLKTNSNYPPNYETIMNTLRWIRDQVRVHMPNRFRDDLRQKDAKGHTDVEISQQKSTTGDISDEDSPRSSADGTLDESQSTAGRGYVWRSAKPKRPTSVQKTPRYPPNYNTIVHVFKSTIRLLLVILGLGIGRIQKIKDKKQQHYWTNLIMDELIKADAHYKYEDDGRDPMLALSGEDQDAFGVLLQSPPDKATTSTPLSAPKQAKEPSGDEENPKQPKSDTAITQKSYKGESAFLLVTSKMGVAEIVKEILESSNTQKSYKGESAFLVASKMGVAEIVKGILESFPVAIDDTDSDGKNVVLLAVENRQTYVYNVLLESNILRDRVFHRLDKDGNSALHLAARFGEQKPWLIPGDALQMQWEMKWYEFVKRSMPRHFFVRENKAGKTAKQILTETHKDLVKTGGEWMTKTAESCSVVAALIATVAFATSATIPGGVDGHGQPNLKDKTLFNVFTISSLVALCFSITSLVFFLTILTSRFQEKDFAMGLPSKLLIGLSALFASIAAILVSFCTGHFFLLKGNLRYVAYPIYLATCLPVTYFALAQLHLYFDLIKCIFQKVPQPSEKR